VAAHNKKNIHVEITFPANFLNLQASLEAISFNTLRIPNDMKLQSTQLDASARNLETNFL
jgi:hypothetical protein